ncbi:hypothetical protein C8J56DRAFT_1052397 [Mycena floridula]|nr:hypothetical protein C8J56DRAFT_1052397 [Mycena floridula]
MGHSITTSEGEIWLCDAHDPERYLWAHLNGLFDLDHLAASYVDSVMQEEAAGRSRKRRELLPRDERREISVALQSERSFEASFSLRNQDPNVELRESSVGERQKTRTTSKISNPSSLTRDRQSRPSYIKSLMESIPQPIVDSIMMDRSPFVASDKVAPLVNASLPMGSKHSDKAHSLSIPLPVSPTEAAMPMLSRVIARSLQGQVDTPELEADIQGLTTTMAHQAAFPRTS